MIVYGIDPGLKGGLAMVGASHPIARPMPTLKLDSGKSRIDCAGLMDFVEACACEPDLIVIEEVSARPGQGVTSMFSFGYGAGILYGWFRAYLPEVRIQYCRPQKWQKFFWQDKPEDTKVRSIEVAGSLYGPEILVPAGCRSPHDGISDALLIATYGRTL